MSIYHDIFTTLAAYARMAEIFMGFDKVIGYTKVCKMISRNRGESRVAAPSGCRHTLRATYSL